MNRSGFTLIETLVALAITSVLVTSAYGLFESAAGLRERLSARAREATRASYTRGLIMELLHGVVRQHGAFTGVNAMVGPHDDDVLEFTAESGRDILTTVDRFRARIDRVPTPHLVVEHFTDEHRTDMVRLAGVSSLDVKFLEHGSATWKPEWPTGSSMPVAVQMTLGGDRLDPLLRVPILVRIRAR